MMWPPQCGGDYLPFMCRSWWSRPRWRRCPPAAAAAPSAPRPASCSWGTRCARSAAAAAAAAATLVGLRRRIRASTLCSVTRCCRHTGRQSLAWRVCKSSVMPQATAVHGNSTSTALTTWVLALCRCGWPRGRCAARGREPVRAGHTGCACSADVCRVLQPDHGAAELQRAQRHCQHEVLHRTCTSRLPAQLLLTCGKQACCSPNHTHLCR
jgi:hypothetical protein